MESHALFYSQESLVLSHIKTMSHVPHKNWVGHYLGGNAIIDDTR